MSDAALVECVPNFSEGRDAETIRAIGAALTVPLLHSTSDRDHNRSVLTFAGSPEEVAESALRAVYAAAERIDIRSHRGVHPRTGAADVVPFVPVSGVDLTRCAALAHRAGARVWDEIGIPVYFYEAAALRPECTRLEQVRRAIGTLTPDVGDRAHPTAGVCIVGARRFLIAWNINLKSSDLAAAKHIAAAIRTSGGGLPALKALGLALPERNRVQVSMNLVDYEQTPLHVVFNRVAELCAQRAIEIEGTELIGLIPQAALEASAGHDLRWVNFSPECVLENALAARPG